MINVPARVKDALRSGEYKKNVKITVENWGAISEHTYTEPEIDIWYAVGPLGDYWTTTDISVNIPNECDYVRITIDGDVGVFGWDEQSYIAYQADPEIFEIDRENNITIITMPNGFRGLSIHGDHIIPYDTIQGGKWDGETILPFTYVKVQGCIDNVIQNDRLVSESVKFDERMCSDSELKFGLCEGTSVEFQYFDLPSILGQKINIELDVEYKGTDGLLDWFTIPMGRFEVAECSRQASTGIRKVTAYNKLQSDYLDVSAKDQIQQMLIDDSDHEMALVDILDGLLNGYAIQHTTWVNVGSKTYAISGTPTSSNSQEQAYFYDSSSGSWKTVTTGTTTPTPRPGAPATSPSSGWFTMYYASFAYIPTNESGTTTTGFYNYTLNPASIYAAIRPYLNTFFDIKNGSVVENSISPFGVLVSEPGMLGTYITFDSYLSRGIGVYYYHPIGSSNTYVDVKPNAPSIVTGPITDSLPQFRVMVAITGSERYSLQSVTPDSRIQAKITQRYNDIYRALSQIQGVTILRRDTSPIEQYRISLNDIDSISNDITLRDLQSASFEIACKYGKLDRESDLFAGVELNQSRLYPADNLYPSDSLYPVGQSEGGYPSMYSKLWADEGNVRSFRYLYVTYKTTETVSGQTQEIEKKLQRTVNANGTDDYIMDDNWLFKNLVWSDADVGAYADAMVAKMQNIRWFPFEMWCAGLPYLEAGDEIEIAMKEGTYPSYILRRTLSGIQNLQDELIDGTLDIF